MDNTAIPSINRKFPKPLKLLFTLMTYLISLPLYWLITKLGFGQKMLSMNIKMSAGTKGGNRAFNSYTPTEHDIFVCTYAKSGTNWMLQIAHQIAFHGAGDYEHIHDVVPWPDLRGAMLKSIALNNQLVQQASPEGKRVIKTHLHAQQVPYNADAHYLVVIRDPKEIFVSSFHFGEGVFGPFMPDFDSWFELFFTPDFPYNFGCNWAEHTAAYWALRDKSNVQLMLYADMKLDLRKTVAKVATFLGATLSNEETELVIEKSSFAYMSKIDDKFIPMPRDNMPWGKKMKMMREGKPGNSKELLTQAQQERIDQHCKQELARLGSDFPYDDYFAGTHA